MKRWLLSLPLSLLAIIPLSATEVIPQGQRQALIRTPHLRVVVPYALRHELLPVAQATDIIYQRLAEDAGYTIPYPLWVIISDRDDRHNGFSQIVPTPMVQVELAAASPEGPLARYEQTLTTLIHEIAHHITNDRDHGFRRVLRRIFGRILPDDIISLALFYLSTPAHQTMPDFWHEGLAMWAESTYVIDADAEAPAGGRAHDPLQWARWRLAVLEDRIPDIGEWRYITHRYPFGRNAYDWGLVYLRFLIRQGYNPWQLTDAQAKRWAFAFNRGIRPLTGANHDTLVDAALRQLWQEMRQQIDLLKASGAAEPTPLTQSAFFQAPVWLDSQRLLAMHASAYERPRLSEIHLAEGRLERSGPGIGFSPLRRIHGPGPEGQPWVLAQASRTRSVRNQLETWIGRRNRVLVLYDGELERRFIRGHFLEGDALWRSQGMVALAAIERGPDSQQRLVIGHVDSQGRGQLPLQDRQVLPTQGRPWQPAWRPESTQLVWVEQYRFGYRLILVEAADPAERRVLLDHEHRIMQPHWSADGQRLYFVSDASGVSNAYVMDLKADQPEIVAVTNVLGKVLAAVPEPEGKRLALLSERADGLSLSIIDAEQRHPQLPRIETPWRAPAESPELTRRIIDLSAAPSVPAITEPYAGLAHFVPLYWTPTTAPVPEGGIGAAGVAADPLMTHVLRLGAGAGVNDGPVARAEYTWSGWHLNMGFAAWHSEYRYEDRYDVEGRSYRQQETRRGGELRLGRGFSLGDRANHLYLAAGLERFHGDFEVPLIPAPENFRLRLRPKAEERYLELRLGRSLGNFRLPDGYGQGSGLSIRGRYRHSGLGGDIEGHLAQASTRFSLDVFPQLGQQLVILGNIGWLDGDVSLRRSFAIGGDAGFLPRGYHEVVDRGRFFTGGSIAWRTPLWRPFTSWGHSALVHRQVILEAFADGAMVDNQAFFGGSDYYTSTGLSLHSSWLVWRAMLNPGIGAAYRFQDERGVRAWFTLDFPW